MVRRRDRRAVLVQADEGAIEVVAREIEIVWVAAEEGGLDARREDQTHVRIFAILVQLELAAVVEIDDLAAILRIGPATLLFDIRSGRGPRLDQSLAGKALPRALHLRSDVCDGGQDLGLHPRALALFLPSVRDIAVRVIIVALARQVLRAAGDAVIVREDQCLGSHHRS
jgi:hypothetical protein